LKSPYRDGTTGNILEVFREVKRKSSSMNLLKKEKQRANRVWQGGEGGVAPVPLEKSDRETWYPRGKKGNGNGTKEDPLGQRGSALCFVLKVKRTGEEGSKGIKRRAITVEPQ